MIRAACLGILLSSGFVAVEARESLNFYVRDPEAAAEEKKAAPADNPPKAEEDNTSQKRSAKEVPKEQKSTRPKPVTPEARPKESSVSSPTPTPAVKARQVEGSTQGKPAGAIEDIQIRSTKRTREFDPPLDPFGLAQAFKSRWDFTNFVISAEEELRFRLNAARARTQKLARAFSSLSEEVEARQRNLNSAALAVYLLSRDQQSWVPIEGRNLTEAQLLAVRATMRQDISAMQSALSDYEVLRDSLNRSAEEVSLLEQKGLPHQAAGLMKDDRISVSTAELVSARTESTLQERLVSLEALKAAMAVENLRNNTERRQSIASFAPPPPTGRAVNRTSPVLPGLPSPEVMEHQPKGETLEAPEKTAVVFETPVNAPVHAVRGGVVVYAGPFRGYGDTVIIEHEKGLFSVYSHLGNIQVLERQPVTHGAIVGRAGTPPELSRPGIHFQVRKGKVPLKPEEWLGENQVQRLLTKG